MAAHDDLSVLPVRCSRPRVSLLACQTVSGEVRLSAPACHHHRYLEGGIPAALARTYSTRPWQHAQAIPRAAVDAAAHF